MIQIQNSDVFLRNDFFNGALYFVSGLNRIECVRRGIYMYTHAHKIYCMYNMQPHIH